MSATFAAPAEPASGLAAYTLEGAARQARRDPIPAALALTRQITSEVFNDLGVGERVAVRPSQEAIDIIPVAAPALVVDVIQALESQAPDWRLTPEGLEVARVARDALVAMQAAVTPEKVQSIRERIAAGALDGPLPVGIAVGAQVFIRDGHHRVIALLCEGAADVEMRLARVRLLQGSSPMTSSVDASINRGVAYLEKGFGPHGFWNGTEPHRGGGGGRGGSRRGETGAAASGAAAPKTEQTTAPKTMSARDAKRTLRELKSSADAAWKVSTSISHGRDDYVRQAVARGKTEAEAATDYNKAVEHAARLVDHAKSIAAKARAAGVTVPETPLPRIPRVPAKG